MVRRSKEIDIQRTAHAREFRAKGGVGADVFGVGEGEVVQERLEDGELGREGGGVAGAQGGAVGGVVVVLEAAGGEGGEAGGAAAVVHRVCVVGMVRLWRCGLGTENAGMFRAEDVTSPKRRYAYAQSHNGYRLQSHRDMHRGSFSRRINITKVLTREPAESGLP